MEIPKEIKVGGVIYKVKFPKTRMKSKDGEGYSDGCVRLNILFILSD